VSQDDTTSNRDPGDQPVDAASDGVTVFPSRIHELTRRDEVFHGINPNHLTAINDRVDRLCVAVIATREKFLLNWPADRNA